MDNPARKPSRQPPRVKGLPERSGQESRLLHGWMPGLYQHHQPDLQAPAPERAFPSRENAGRSSAVQPRRGSALRALQRGALPCSALPTPSTWDRGPGRLLLLGCLPPPPGARASLCLRGGGAARSCLCLGGSGGGALYADCFRRCGTDPRRSRRRKARGAAGAEGCGWLASLTRSSRSSSSSRRLGRRRKRQKRRKENSQGALLPWVSPSEARGSGLAREDLGGEGPSRASNGP